MGSVFSSEFRVFEVAPPGLVSCPLAMMDGQRIPSRSILGWWFETSDYCEECRNGISSDIRQLMHLNYRRYLLHRDSVLYSTLYVY